MKMSDAKPKRKSVRKVLLTLLKDSVIAISIFGAGAGVFLYFNIYFSEGNGPAGPAVPAEPFARKWSERKVVLLGIGDSITDGFSAPEGFGYFDRLIKNPPEDCSDMLDKNLSVVFPNLTFKNLATCGTVSKSHLERIQNLEPYPGNVFGIVVMTTGGNDLIHEYGRMPPKECAMYGATLGQAQPWIKNFKERLDQMIPGIKAKFPGGCEIFLANIYDPSDGTSRTTPWLTGMPEWPDGVSILRAYNGVIGDCAKKYEYVHLVNIHDEFLGHGIHCKKFWIKHYRANDPHYWYSLIIEDPNHRGYDAIRRLFLIEMIKVLSAREWSDIVKL
jgi:lysophospholipase L1-like esterase